MLANSLECAQRQAQTHFAPRFPTPPAAFHHAPIKKRNNLRAQRLDINDVEMLDVHAGPRATRTPAAPDC